MIPRTTRNAAERWMQRIEGASSIWSAGNHLQVSCVSGIDVPYRYAQRSWSKWRDFPRLRSRTKYRVSAKAIFVMSRDRVITVYPLPPEDLATVLTWAMTGMWP